MNPTFVAGAYEADRVALANMTPRFLRLHKFETYVEGTQYQGRSHFLSNSSNKPLLERAPCIVYPIVQSAIRSHVDLCMGENRFPSITSFESEDDREFDPDYGLSEEDSAVIDKSIQKIIDRTRLNSKLKMFLEAALASGTAVVLCGVRNGFLFVENIHAKWCTPTFKPASNELIQIEIRYPYFVHEYDQNADCYRKKCKLYRRVITESYDLVYKPVDAREDGREPSWKEESKSEHNLGFCPVIWYPCMKECSVISDIDGHAIHEDLLDEIDALNFSLSQWYRAALYAGDPRLFEIGVDKEAFVSELGRPTSDGSFPLSSNPTYALESMGYEPEHPKLERMFGVRKTGVTQTLRYENPDAKVGLLTLPGDALQAISSHADNLRAKLCEALSVLWIDPETAKLASDISGKALELLFKRQTARCDQIRSDFGDHCLLPLIHMLMRVAYVTYESQKLYVDLPGISKLTEVLNRFQRDNSGAMYSSWVCPHLDLVWPHYFTPTDADGVQVSQMLQNVLPLGLITKEMALQRLKPFFVFNSAKDVLEAVQKEQEEEQENVAGSDSTSPPSSSSPQNQQEEESPPISMQEMGDPSNDT